MILINQNKNGESEYTKIKVTAIYAKKASLRVNAGHGLTYKSAKIL